MRIACPSCAAEYDVPASRLPPHKKVRCVRCGGEWVPVREAIETEPETEAALPEPVLPVISAPPPVAPPIAGPAVSGKLAPSPVGLAAAWVMTFIFLAASLAATIVWRADIMRAWPPSRLILTPMGEKTPDTG